MGTIASQITSLTSVYSNVYSGADQSKHQSSASLAFVWGIHRGPVNSPHKWPVTRKMFPFDDVIMITENSITHIPDGYFDGFLQLTRLDLAKNCLTQVPDVSPIHQTLITLSVLSNYISEIPHFMGDNIFISLKSLILSNNNIQAFPPSLLSKFPNLQEFFISINNLHTLDESVFGGIHAVVLVRLSGNPWICDSALAWLCDLKLKNYSFMGFAKQFKSYGHIGITDYERLVCAGPDR